MRMAFDLMWTFYNLGWKKFISESNADYLHKYTYMVKRKCIKVRTMNALGYLVSSALG